MPAKRMPPRKTKKARFKRPLAPVQTARLQIIAAKFFLHKAALLYPEKELTPKILALRAAKISGTRPKGLPKIISYVRGFLSREKKAMERIRIARDSCMKAGLTQEAAGLVAQFDKIGTAVINAERLLPPKKPAAIKPKRKIPN